MMMLEDLRVALRQICRAMGLPGDAATVVSLIVLGVGLNVVALRAVEYAGIGGHACHDRTGRTVLGSAARTELKVMRTVVVSTLKKFGDSGRRLIFSQQRLREGSGYHVEVGSAWAAPTNDECCDAMVVSRSGRRMAVALVQC
jgi:hypothetical protein